MTLFGPSGLTEDDIENERRGRYSPVRLVSSAAPQAFRICVYTLIFLQFMALRLLSMTGLNYAASSCESVSFFVLQRDQN